MNKEYATDAEFVKEQEDKRRSAMAFLLTQAVSTMAGAALGVIFGLLLLWHLALSPAQQRAEAGLTPANVNPYWGGADSGQAK